MISIWDNSARQASQLASFGAAEQTTNHKKLIKHIKLIYYYIEKVSLVTVYAEAEQQFKRGGGVEKKSSGFEFDVFCLEN